MLETCRGFHHKRAGEFELILPVTSTGQISQCLKCSCLWATSPYFSPCEAIVRAAFSIKFEAGLPWDSLVRLYFVDLCCSLYMIGTTIHSNIHFIYILYTFYTLFVCLCLSEFIVAPAAWTMTVVAQARGGSGPRLSATMPAPQQRPSVVIDSDNLQSSPKDFPITRCHTFHSLLQ